MKNMTSWFLNDFYDFKWIQSILDWKPELISKNNLKQNIDGYQKDLNDSMLDNVLKYIF